MTEAVKITDRVFWVGAVDRSLRDFHGYATGRGSTYNAFLVLGEEITLIDTVKAPFKDEMLGRIRSVLDPSRIKYIVSNHSEMDHSGCLLDVIREVKPEKVFASPMGLKALDAHFHAEGPFVAVKDGERLTLGGVEYLFLETRMLHWPDSMFTYLPGEGVLFSQDAFGSHYASKERFAHEVPWEALEYESAKYFANIIMPYSHLVTKLLERIGKLGLDMRMILPDHGPLWTKDTGRILDLYAKWALQKPTRKTVLVYATMWGSTAAMAEKIAEGLAEGGAEVKSMPLSASHRSDVATEILEAGALLVGSPTINNMLFPSVADVLAYLKGLKPKNLLGGAFGSYGWSGEGARQTAEILKEMKIELVAEPLSVKYVPREEDLGEAKEFGRSVAEKLREFVGS